MKIDAASIEAFFVAAGEREAALRQLDALIRAAAPALQPKLVTGMKMTMLGYGTIHYRSRLSKELQEWPLVALAPQKHYISLYVCAVIDGQYVAEANKAQLGKVSVGKSCIRFRHLTDLRQDTLQTLLIDLNRRYVAGEHLFGNQ